MPNLFAYLALAVFPIVSGFLFRSFSIPKAIVWTFLIGYMLLPEKVSFILPGFPDIGKFELSSLSAAFWVWFTSRKSSLGRQTRLLKSGHRVDRNQGMGIEFSHVEDTRPLNSSAWLIGFCVATYVVSPFFTFLNNRDALVIGARYIPGLSAKDGVAMMASSLISLIPFFLARNHLAGKEEQREMLGALAFAAVCYSFLVLIEIRLSPQLHTWFYGFFPHMFNQQKRYGGFRAVVFMGHGLVVALFLCMAYLSARSLASYAPMGERRRWQWFSRYLLLILILQKSVGAILIALVFMPVVLIKNSKPKYWFLGGLAFVILLYPILRFNDILPVRAIAAQISEIDLERGGSLQMRVYNEDIILEKAKLRSLTGWGEYGRYRIYNSEGKDITVSDSLWAIVFGKFGWLGYIGLFGLLLVPVIGLARAGRGLKVDSVTICVAIVLMANMADAIPNASLSPITFLLAGSLAGQLRYLSYPVAGHRAIMVRRAEQQSAI